MTEITSAQDLEKYIDYEFSDPTILEEARTRQAFRNENPSLNLGCMDSLATLGDAVPGAVVVLRFYENGKQKKGELTKRKVSGIRRERTHAFAVHHKLGNYVQWGEGERLQECWTQGNKAPDTVTEALIGAVFLDAQKRELNGMSIVVQMLERLKYF